MSALEDYFKNKDAVDKEAVTQELLGEKLSKKHSPGLFMKLLDVLDRPGNATRALLVGKLGGLKGLIPFAQLMEDLTGWDIALNKEDRVAGTEVIEKFFGRQPQRKGKLDMVDALGLLVEVVADPLWLVGGAGMTKLGKARALVGSNVKGLLASAKAVDNAADAAKYVKRASDILKAVHAGKMPANVSGKLAKAITTVSKAKGPTTLRSLSWAKQAARGERAALNVLGHPVIKGQKTIAKAEKLVNKIRTGVIGEKFLSATRRTNLEHADLHKLYNAVKTGKQFDYGKTLGKFKKAQKVQSELSKKTGLAMDDVGELAARLAELGDAPSRYKGLVADIRSGKIKGQQVELIESAYSRYAGELNEITSKIGKDNLPKLRRLADEAKVAKQWLEESRRLGIPIEDVGGDLEYVTRVMSRDYNKATKKDIFRIDRPQTSGLGIYKGKAKGRDVTANMIRPQVDEFYAKPVGAETMFEKDMLTSLAEGGRQHMNRASSAETIHKAIKKFGKPLKGHADKGYVSVRNIMAKMDDAHLPTLTNMDTAKQLPMDIANALFNSFKQTIPKESDVMAAKLWEGAQRLMKGAYTVPFPAFHARNAFSNKILNWLEGTWKPSAYIDSFKLQSAAAKTRRVMRKEGLEFMEAAKKVNWPTLMVNGRKTPGYMIFDLADKKGILGRTIGIFDPEEIAGATFSKPHKGVMKWLSGEDPIARGGRAVGSTIEDHDRLAHFIDKLTDGLNPDDAAASAKTALFDYGDLSEFEKTWLRNRLVFFYTFARKNLGQQMRKLIQQPAKQGLFSHLAGGTPRIQAEAKDRPSYMNERLAIPTPFYNEEGNRYSIKSLGTPIEEAFGPLAAPGTGAWNRTSRLVSRQLGRANPAITGAFELATKKNLYFDRPIDDPVEWIVQKTPAGRVYGTYRGFKEGRDTTPSKISGLATGVRFNAPDPVKQKAYQVRQIAKDYLERHRQTRTYKRYYVPKDKVIDDPLLQYAMEVQ
jgi:hypothetical protein